MLTFVFVFVVVAAVLGLNHIVRLGSFKQLTDEVSGRRLLGRGRFAFETDTFVVEVVGGRWRVEVPHQLLGKEMVLTLTPAITTIGGLRTGFHEIDNHFAVSSDDEARAAAVLGEPDVRAAIAQMRQRCRRIVRLDITAAETLVVLLDAQRGGRREALESIAAVAAAFNAALHVRPQVSAGTTSGGSVGAGSGSPFALPGARR